ncbi:MAG: threonine/serine dehydratase [Candidatus Caldarchaeum sp.]|nr:threonine/serine dehydratase [Candidatus Caldarchaeum sp.]
MVTLKEVYEARKIVSKYIKPTPLVYSRHVSRELGADVYYKLENSNPTNSFKVRGGVYFMYLMHDEIRGVVTASMGNHAQSIAYAGSFFGVETTVVMPSWVSRIKRQAVEELGAKVLTHGSYYDEAAAYALHYAEKNGLRYVDAVNEEKLYPGVATMHLEVFEELPDLQVFINPLAGGSGAIGAVTVYKSLNPEVRVYGVQAEGAPAFYLSLKKGEICSTENVKTLAEGLAIAKTYPTPFNILKNKLDDVLLVSDEEMEKAVVKIFQSVRQVAELAGAASTAAAYRYVELMRGKKVVLNLTGGNIDHKKFAEILSRH